LKQLFYFRRKHVYSFFTSKNDVAIKILHKRAAEFIVCKAICHILLKHLVIYNVFRIFL